MPSAPILACVRPAALKHIGITLAPLYETLVREGVPAHLATCVRRLQVQERRSRPMPRACALVVEPDPHVRMLAELTLDETMIVVGCESAEAALPILRARGSEVVLVVADLRLAGPLSGLALARAVASGCPGTRMILTSAGAAEPDEPLPAGVSFLRKPWSCADLIAEARRASAAV